MGVLNWLIDYTAGFTRQCGNTTVHAAPLAPSRITHALVTVFAACSCQNPWCYPVQAALDEMDVVPTLLPSNKVPMGNDGEERCQHAVTMLASVGLWIEAYF